MESKEDSIKITNTYIPAVSQEFVLKKLKNRVLRSCSPKSKEESKESDSVVQIGIADAMIRNKQYKELTFAVEIDQFKSEAILEQVHAYLFGSPEVKENYQFWKFRYSKIAEGLDENMKQLIIEKYKDGWSIKSLSSLFDAWETTIRNVINEDKFNKTRAIKHF